MRPGTPRTPTNADTTNAVKHAPITEPDNITDRQRKQDQGAPLFFKNQITSSRANRMRSKRTDETVNDRVETADIQPSPSTDPREVMNDARGRWVSVSAQEASQHVSGITPTAEEPNDHQHEQRQGDPLPSDIAQTSMRASQVQRETVAETAEEQAAKTGATPGLLKTTPPITERNLDTATGEKPPKR